MHKLKSIAAEIMGLFVDDGAFALAIVVWLAFSLIVFPHLHATARWSGSALFIGLALILAEAVLSFGARKRK